MMMNSILKGIAEKNFVLRNKSKDCWYCFDVLFSRWTTREDNLK